MRGVSHAVSGAAAGTAVGLFAPTPALALVCVAVSAAAALGPDIDHPRSLASNCLGPVSWLACRLVRLASRLVGLPEHRGLSHTDIVGLLVGAAVAVGLLALNVPQAASLLVGAAAAVGWWTHLWGDWTTKTSLPCRWWPLMDDFPGPPRCLRITTGKWVETVLLWVVFTPACAVGLYLTFTL